MNTKRVQQFFPGDLVEVRSWPEIAGTLDAQGMLDNLPFMPEMLAFCGRQFRVSRQAFKTCIDDREMRGLTDTVFLADVRCDGASHGGCARGCLMFWKQAWLKPAGTDAATNGHGQAKLSVEDLNALAQRDGQFVCQSTELIAASTPLPWWRAKQYLWDLTRNRVSITNWLWSILIAAYNKFAHLGGFDGWGVVAGEISDGVGRAESLNLQPGEIVRVKSLEEIRKTLDRFGKHQHLFFAPTMAQFCGRVLRVRNRIDNIILEGTREQRKLKDTVALDEGVCDGICHRMCPRQSFLFWRECWLERVETN